MPNIETTEWQPIETAPTDAILGLVGRMHMIVQRHPAGYWTSWNYKDGILRADRMTSAPSHWLPLPPVPPRTEEEEEAFERALFAA